jgi:taurine dioxygenase
VTTHSVNRVYTKRIEGFTRAESDGLLSALCNHAESPDFQVRFKRSQHAVAIWDNRSTQHFAVADCFPARRVMHRVALEGEGVVSGVSSRVQVEGSER